MKTFIGCLFVTIALFAPEAHADDAPVQCHFIAPNGSVLLFVGDEDQKGRGHILVDGRKCSYVAEKSITCGKRTDMIEVGPETIEYRDQLYTSPEHCGAGPE